MAAPGFGYVVQLGGTHPAKVDVFTDIGSLGHLALGFGVAALGAPGGSATLAAFIGYEVSKLDSGETWARIGGKFIELAIGIILGALLLRRSR